MIHKSNDSIPRTTQTPSINHTMSITAAQLDAKIKEQLKDNYYQTIIEDTSNGCGLNFECIVISDIFKGMTKLARARFINKMLKDELEVIHAFSSKSYTVEEWANKRV